MIIEHDYAAVYQQANSSYRDTMVVPGVLEARVYCEFDGQYTKPSLFAFIALARVDPFVAGKYQQSSMLQK
jgi:hypothetical protein